MTTTHNSEQLFEQAKKVIPGGVNSPVRAFTGVGGTPRFMKKANGAWLMDADGNVLLDLINSWGPMILGHCHPDVVAAIQETAADAISFGAPTEREAALAELMTKCVPSLERVRLGILGTEATMSAIRLARGYTGRQKIVKFVGCYHGHGDSFLIAAGSGAATLGTPSSPGVTPGTAQDTLVAPYNDLEAVQQLFTQFEGQIAAVILEPVAGNMGLVVPDQSYLVGLRNLCTQHGTLLIYDEVMTGFRLSIGGAQVLQGIVPDLSTFGKVIGGGMPVGAYGGSARIMDHIAPVGKVYQAGTLSGNPLAMAAGLATLTFLYNNSWVFDTLKQGSATLAAEIQQIIQRHGLPCHVVQFGSMVTVFMRPEPVRNFADASACNMQAFSRWFHAMLHEGVYLPPSQYETWFISLPVAQEQVGYLLERIERTLPKAF